jgi:hypothetical protein
MNEAITRSSAALPMLRHPDLLRRLALEIDVDQNGGSSPTTTRRGRAR